MKTFKEWLVLSETVEVRVEIPQEKRKVEPPKNLFDLAWHLNGAAKLPMEQIAIDGFEIHSTEGIINFYTFSQYGNKVPAEKQKEILEKVFDEMKKIGAVLTGAIVKNTFRDYINEQMRKSKEYGWNFSEKELIDHYKEKNIDLDDVRVYRLPVKIDASLAADNEPRINMGFDVAKIVFEDFFGLPHAGPNPVRGLIGSFTGLSSGEEQQPWNGYYFDVDHIIKVYERIKDELENHADMESKPGGWQLKHGEEIDDPEDQYNLGHKIKYQGPSMYFGGVSRDLILQRVRDVYNLALWGKKHGYSKMYAA